MPTLTFTTGPDSYTVTAAATGTFDLSFLAGNDILRVIGGTFTTAHMGDGDDLVRVDSSDGAFYGDAGADRFELYASGIEADGGADNDLFNIRGGSLHTLNGGIGDDRFNFYAGAASVSLFGGDGNDGFYGFNQTVTGSLYGNAGNDYFSQFGGAVTLYGGTGNDIYRADASNPATFVENIGEGTDAVQVARGATYTLPANIENISVQGFSGSTLGAAALTGNPLNNTINGHFNVETMYGLAGNDRLYGKGGNDTLWGGDGQDILDGGDGNDTLNGEAGNDTLNGQAGDDVMDGGAGDDNYYVDSTGDVIGEGFGAGTDIVRSTVSLSLNLAGGWQNVENATLNGTANLSLTGNSLGNVLTGNSGDNFLDGLTGDDTLRGGLGNDLMFGGPGNDVLQGGDGADGVYGGGDNDTLFGGAGDDAVDGFDGDDFLFGQGGADTMIGGLGIDTFVYTSVSDSTAAAQDVINAFESASGGGNDQIDFSAIDANTAMDGDQAFGFSYSGPVANGIWYSYVFDGGGLLDITLYGDVNGDSVADFQVLVNSTTDNFYVQDLTL